MKQKNRHLVDVIKTRLEEKDPLIQVIIGPRQVGKTTALITALDGRGIYETADSPTPLNADVVLNWWQQATQSESKILAIDEVQKISGWSEIVKKLWDTQRGIKLILTGSSAMMMEKGLSESLAGRYELIVAEHWNYSEAKEIFNMSLRDFIEYGCYPGSMRFFDNTRRWGDYIRDSIVEPVIGRDLLQLYPVQQPALLRQIFGLALTIPAQIMSMQKMQGEMQGKLTVPTIRHYLDLLESAYAVTSVEKYSESQLRQKRSIPKIIVHDNAFLKAFRRPVDEELSPDVVGMYFENAIGARFIEAGWDVYYWRDRNLEVDFVVLGPDGEKLAIEVKSSETGLSELQGLKEFCTRHPLFEPCLCSLVGQKFEQIRCLDIEQILSMHRHYV